MGRGEEVPPPFLQLAQVNLFNDDIAIVGLLLLFLYGSFQILYTGKYFFKRSRSAHFDITKKHGYQLGTGLLYAVNKGRISLKTYTLCIKTLLSIQNAPCTDRGIVLGFFSKYFIQLCCICRHHIPMSEDATGIELRTGTS